MVWNPSEFYRLSQIYLLKKIYGFPGILSNFGYLLFIIQDILKFMERPIMIYKPCYIIEKIIQKPGISS